MRFIISLILNTLALLATTYIVPDFEINYVASAIMAAVVIAIVNTIIRPILLFITAPINFLTLGLFSLVVNAFTLWLASLLVPGFQIESVIAAIAAVLVLSLLSVVLNLLRRELQTKDAQT